MPEPQIIIIPGSFMSSLQYYDVRDAIRRTHPELPDPLVYDLPSASCAPPLPAPTLYDDAAFFAKKITHLVDAEEVGVVLLAHSYGGLVAREALRGLSKEERLGQGKKGGVVRVIYLSSVIAEPGQSSFDVLDGVLDSEPLDPIDENYARQKPYLCAQQTFSDLPEREGIRHAVRTTIHSMVSMKNPTSELSNLDKCVPSTYISCTEDHVLPPSFQKERIEILKSQSGAEKVQTLVLETGHCPNASAPDQVAKMVCEIVTAL